MTSSAAAKARAVEAADGPLLEVLVRRMVGEVHLDEAEAIVAPAELGEPVALQLDAVIIVDVVDADHLLAAGEQPVADVEADEAGRAGHEDGHEACPKEIVARRLDEGGA